MFFLGDVFFRVRFFGLDVVRKGRRSAWVTGLDSEERREVEGEGWEFC